MQLIPPLSSSGLQQMQPPPISAEAVQYEQWRQTWPHCLQNLLSQPWATQQLQLAVWQQQWKNSVSECQQKIADSQVSPTEKNWLAKYQQYYQSWSQWADGHQQNLQMAQQQLSPT